MFVSPGCVPHANGCVTGWVSSAARPRRPSPPPPPPAPPRGPRAAPSTLTLSVTSPSINPVAPAILACSRCWRTVGTVSQRHPAHCFSAVFRPFCAVFSAVPLRCPASWRRDGENGRKMAENGQYLGEKEWWLSGVGHSQRLRNGCRRPGQGAGDAQGTEEAADGPPAYATTPPQPLHPLTRIAPLTRNGSACLRSFQRRWR